MSFWRKLPSIPSSTCLGAAMVMIIVFPGTAPTIKLFCYTSGVAGPASLSSSCYVKGEAEDRTGRSAFERR